jgi:hypothetical protein
MIAFLIAFLIISLLNKSHNYNQHPTKIFHFPCPTNKKQSNELLCNNKQNETAYILVFLAVQIYRDREGTYRVKSEGREVGVINWTICHATTHVRVTRQVEILNQHSIIATFIFW